VISGFQAAVRAGEHPVEQVHALGEASITIMARRIAAGQPADDIAAPDLRVYDTFMRGKEA
jgi:hypothetical protein